MDESALTVVVDKVRREYFYHLTENAKLFDAVVFDEQQLQAKELLQGLANAGRGNTFFLEWAGCQLVLRHYRRGGMIRHISSDKYIFTGYKNSRAVREFEFLLKMQALGLPAPLPYACKVRRHGLLYSASLVTHRLSGLTFSDHLQKGHITDLQWKLVGQTIALFHGMGIFHADLNANNIMIDDDNNVSLIDFDRAELRSLPADAGKSGWCLNNINRLHRSLLKLSGKADATHERTLGDNQNGFDLLCAAWSEQLLK